MKESLLPINANVKGYLLVRYMLQTYGVSYGLLQRARGPRQGVVCVPEDRSRRACDLRIVCDARLCTRTL